MTISLLADRTREGALGLFGGGAGMTGRASVNGETINAKRQFPLPPGGLLVLETPGGGGYGDARERARELVERDLALGYVTPDNAAEVYGFYSRDTNDRQPL